MRLLIVCLALLFFSSSHAASRKDVDHIVDVVIPKSNSKPKTRDVRYPKLKFKSGRTAYELEFTSYGTVYGELCIKISEFRRGGVHTTELCDTDYNGDVDSVTQKSGHTADCLKRSSCVRAQVMYDRAIAMALRYYSSKK